MLERTCPDNPKSLPGFYAQHNTVPEAAQPNHQPISEEIHSTQTGKIIPCLCFGHCCSLPPLHPTGLFALQVCSQLLSPAELCKTSGALQWAKDSLNEEALQWCWQQWWLEAHLLQKPVKVHLNVVQRQQEKNLIIQFRERNSRLQWRQWKTLACASKTHSPTLPLISLVGEWFVWTPFFGLKSTDPRAFPFFLHPTVSAVTSLLLSSPWNWYHAELTAAITTVTLLWELCSSSEVKKFQKQMFSLAEANKPISLFPCF